MYCLYELLYYFCNVSEDKRVRQEEYESNPYIADLVLENDIVPIRFQKSKKKEFLDTEENTFHNISVKGGEYFYDWKDDREFRKLYSGRLNTLRNLSSNAMQMFFFVLEKLQVNKDMIVITVSDFLKYSGFKSRAQYYSATYELVEHKILARSKSSFTFFINPTIVFNGKVDGLLPDAKEEFGKVMRGEKGGARVIIRNKKVDGDI